jgi:hypothetical protein
VTGFSDKKGGRKTRSFAPITKTKPSFRADVVYVDSELGGVNAPVNAPIDGVVKAIYARRSAELMGREKEILEDLNRRIHDVKPKRLAKMVAVSKPTAMRKRKVKAASIKKKARAFKRRKNTQLVFIAYVRRPEESLPGAAMLKIAETLFTRERVDNVYKPAIADYQHEMRAAREEGGLKPLVTRLEHWWAFLKTCGFGTLFELAGKIWKLLS